MRFDFDAIGKNLRRLRGDAPTGRYFLETEVEGKKQHADVARPDGHVFLSPNTRTCERCGCGERDLEVRFAYFANCPGVKAPAEPVMLHRTEGEMTFGGAPQEYWLLPNGNREWRTIGPTPPLSPVLKDLVDAYDAMLRNQMDDLMKALSIPDGKLRPASFGSRLWGVDLPKQDEPVPIAVGGFTEDGDYVGIDRIYSHGAFFMKNTAEHLTKAKRYGWTVWDDVPAGAGLVRIRRAEPVSAMRFEPAVQTIMGDIHIGADGSAIISAVPKP